MVHRAQPQATSTTEKYLRRHAEPVAAVGASVPGGYRHVLVVPARNEDASMLEGLSPALSPTSLLVLVVNGTANDGNDRLLRALEAAMKHRKELGDGCCHGRIEGNPVVIVDRGASFSEKGGVGLARKLGADLALALHARGAVASPWIHMTDADALLPPSYFEATASTVAGAYCYPFAHVPGEDPVVNEATQLYEWSLRYYVAGLRWAGSPYAYHSIGSTMAVRADSYAGVRGMPQRAAGEDFYLLNKVAKTYGVAVGTGPPVRLRARRSDRVPFGTGPAIARIIERGLTSYDPRCFAHLSRWLRALRSAAQSGRLDRLRRHDDAMGMTLTTRDWKTLRALLNQPPADQRERRLHAWFDAFRTLKYIHALRDQLYPNRPWSECARTAPFEVPGAPPVGR